MKNQKELQETHFFLEVCKVFKKGRLIYFLLLENSQL